MSDSFDLKQSLLRRADDVMEKLDEKEACLETDTVGDRVWIYIVRKNKRGIRIAENGYWEVNHPMGAFGRMPSFEEALEIRIAENGCWEVNHPMGAFGRMPSFEEALEHILTTR